MTVHPPPSPQDFDCVVLDNAPLTHDTRLLRLAIPADVRLHYKAGQFARLSLPGGVTREYSIGNPPPVDGTPARCLEFHVRLSNASAVSGSRIIHEQVKAGDMVHVHAPLGASHWREAHAGPTLLVAGGTGLAPMMAIAEATLGAGRADPVRLYLGARDERDVYGEPRLRELARRFANFSYVIVLSEPTGQTGRRQGLVTDALAQDLPALTGAKVYLAGPPPMVQGTLRWLRSQGVPETDIHTDAY